MSRPSTSPYGGRHLVGLAAPAATIASMSLTNSARTSESVKGAVRVDWPVPTSALRAVPHEPAPAARVRQLAAQAGHHRAIAEFRARGAAVYGMISAISITRPLLRTRRENAGVW